MSKEVNKQAIALTTAFYKAIDKKVTPALMKQGIGQFRNLMSVYTFEELSSVIEYLAEGNMPGVYSPGYLSYATNKILDDIKIRKMKSEQSNKATGMLDMSLDNEKKRKPSAFLDKFM